MFQDTTISFIGSGMMGGAIIGGLVAQKQLINPQQIIAADIQEARLAELHQQYGIGVTTNSVEAAKAGQIVVLSIKPQILPKVMPLILGHLAPTDLLLSIMAGISIKTIADGLSHTNIVRAMPNTPAQIGQGITVWTTTEQVSEKQKAQAQTILKSLGKEIYVDDEKYLDMTTAVSSSGVGYVFLIMEAMIDAAVHLGFSRAIATQLVYQTIRGSVELAEQSGKHPAQLRHEVTSPGGTTAAALYQMEKGGLRTALANGIWAAYQRSVVLGRGGENELIS